MLAGKRHWGLVSLEEKFHAGKLCMNVLVRGGGIFHGLGDNLGKCNFGMILFGDLWICFAVFGFGVNW